MTDYKLLDLIEPAAAARLTDKRALNQGDVPAHVLEAQEEEAVALSFAISLKRIADWLEGNGSTFFTDRLADAIAGLGPKR